MADLLAMIDDALARLQAVRADLLAEACPEPVGVERRGGARHGRAWTAEDIALMRERYATTPGAEMRRLLNRSKTSIQHQARRMGLHHDRYWADAEVALLREKYADTATDVLAAEIGCKPSAVLAMANKLRIRKAKAFLAELAAKSRLAQFGEAHRYRKGNVPKNKGKRSPGQTYGRMHETWFRSDKPSWRTMPVGATREVDGYVYRKIADTMRVPWTRNWKIEHVRLWEEANGPVPPGHIVVFRDRNRRNFALDNLECISLAEHMRRNSIHNLPAPLKEVIMLNGRLKRKLRRIDEKQTVRSEEPSVRDARSA